MMEPNFFDDDQELKSQRKRAIERRKKDRRGVDEFDDVEFIANHHKDKKRKSRNASKQWGFIEEESELYYD
ncbi:MAG: hypothetical protein RLP44_10015 [Aggregatilineales bacterium]